MGFSLFPTANVRRSLTVLAICAMTALEGCSRDKALEYKEQSIYEIYSQAVRYVEQERYTDAAKYFDKCTQSSR